MAKKVEELSPEETLALAKLAVEKAEADLAAAKDIHAAADAVVNPPAPPPPPEPEPVFGEHVLLDLGGKGHYSLIPIAEIPGYNFARDGLMRTVSVGGRNYEHVDTHPSGVWCYRGM